MSQVHRLLITAIMLASKFFDDVYYNNAYYARVGGISNSEVNSLEMEMLRMISVRLAPLGIGLGALRVASLAHSGDIRVAQSFTPLTFPLVSFLFSCSPNSMTGIAARCTLT